MAIERHDYAFPFRIAPLSRQAQRAAYPAHVAQMVRQVLLTTPGERADLPAFGCGLRALVFAPNSDALSATTQILVQQALGRWLADHLIVRKVVVRAPEDSPGEATILVRVEYELLATRSLQQIEVEVA